MNPQRIDTIKEKLQAAITVEFIDVDDQSHLHAGHAGAKDGRGHFHLTLVSPDFDGKNRIARHKQVYAALGDMLQTDIHALSMDLYSLDEFEN